MKRCNQIAKKEWCFITPQVVTTQIFGLICWGVLSSPLNNGGQFNLVCGAHSAENDIEIIIIISFQQQCCFCWTPVNQQIFEDLFHLVESGRTHVCLFTDICKQIFSYINNGSSDMKGITLLFITSLFCHIVLVLLPTMFLFTQTALIDLVSGRNRQLFSAKNLFTTKNIRLTKLAANTKPTG